MKIESPRLESAGSLAPFAGERLVAGEAYECQMFDGSQLIGQDAEKVRIEMGRFLKVDLSQAKLHAAMLADLEFSSCTLAGTDMLESGLHRLWLHECRLTGLKLTEAFLKDVRITDSKADLLLLRMARCKDVRFEGCNLRGADFYGTDLRAACFDRCDLEGADFSQAKLAGVDLRTCHLVDLRGLDGLKGAIVTPAQLITLAYGLAGQLGIVVEEG
jgi:uncharacterized protein YjbI with pentapeptide repeats